MDTRSARLKLAERREPYWTVISAGCAIGYRRGTKSGTWIARLRSDNGKQHYEALGAADDARDADGLTSFTFSQAQERARTFFDRTARELAGRGEPQAAPYTVEAAIGDYLAAREQRGSKGVRSDRCAAAATIVPELGKIELSKLTAKRIRDWHERVVSSARRVRTGRFAAVIHYLSGAECKRLVNATQGRFRDLVRGALVTGCRYGELIRMRIADLNASAGTVTIRLSKAGKPRHVVLAGEGRALFEQLTAGRAPQDLIFRRDDGGPWGATHKAACRSVSDCEARSARDLPHLAPHLC